MRLVEDEVRKKGNSAHLRSPTAGVTHRHCENHQSLGGEDCRATAALWLCPSSPPRVIWMVAKERDQAWLG